jgi:hypothetical protein
MMKIANDKYARELAQNWGNVANPGPCESRGDIFLRKFDRQRQYDLKKHAGGKYSKHNVNFLALSLGIFLIRELSNKTQQNGDHDQFNHNHCQQ